jgi:hypothetical protein
MRTWTRGLAAALVLGVVVTLAAAPATLREGPAGLEDRVSYIEGVLTQMNERLRTLEWLVGLSMAWNTLLIGSAVGLLLKYR